MIQDRQQVPFSAVPAAPRDYVCIVMHTIQAGDTLYSISHRYNVTVSALMQANDISNPYDLHVGRQTVFREKKNSKMRPPAMGLSTPL